MNRFATSSWQIRVEERHGLIIGLYARDVAGLRSRTDCDIPPLTPAVGIRSDLAHLAGPETSAEWDRWWRRELLQQDETGPGLYPPLFPALEGSPRLAALIRACFEDAVAWNARRYQQRSGISAGDESCAPEGDLVGRVEAEIGRKARPFRLVVTRLPVAGDTGWRVAPGHVLVSEARRDNPSAYGAWLMPVIRELA